MLPIPMLLLLHVLWLHVRHGDAEGHQVLPDLRR